ncbi:uncharacterized protein PHACADRAFT_149312 [Phanerochaete carnosa HHB-10118-sp]|uniref:NADAR domain-containing protein n=1 Tax=Phanerochaete carnosa (strain HHB-10118-sp) TaxID=650164 RepID=K5W0D6_PHACS|nr:uncharacterized protein PHACADRAFT_149312 [Phanerochaete carnosa HHB-10118-sp]EKM52565.1 hypothetical protein PHACADRAFT_149312 [Phanerochaete carnosa HHB-10118-sp]
MWKWLLSWLSQPSVEYQRRWPEHREASPRADGNSAHTRRTRVAEKSVTRSPIFFYDRGQPYYEFTNFSPHSVWYDGKEYPTSEHLFQAHKFFNKAPHLAETIRMQPTSRAALEEARRLRRLQRSDWLKVNIHCMDAVLEAKFTQHPRLRSMLLSTGDRELVEASPVDAFWGYGADKQGRNELGKALMRLRQQFRAQEVMVRGRL